MSPSELARQIATDGAAPDSESASRLLRLCHEDVQTAGECAALLVASAQQEMRARPIRAEELALLAASCARSGSAHAQCAAALRVLGQVLRLQGKHERVPDVLADAARCAESAGDDVLQAQVQVGAIDSLGMIGRVDEAVALGASLLDRFQQLGRPSDAGKVLVNIANLHFRRDEHAAALDGYRGAAALLGEAQDTVARAMVEGNCANTLAHLNRIDEALDLVARSRAGFTEVGMRSAVAMADANEGYLRYISGEHTKAVSLLSSARSEFSRSEQSLEWAKCEADLGDVYGDLNLWPEALSSYEGAIDAFVRIPLPYEQAKALLGRARVLGEIGRNAEALFVLGEAEELFVRQRNTVQICRVRLVRASILRRMGDSDEAREQARLAMSGFMRTRMRGWAAEARLVMCEIDLERGHDRQRSIARVGAEARRFGRPWLACRADYAVGRWHAEHGDALRAIRSFRRAVKELEALRELVVTEELHTVFLRDKLSVVEALVEALVARGGKRDIWEALEHIERSKSRLLLDRIRAEFEARVPADLKPELQARLDSLRTELTRAYQLAETVREPGVDRVSTPIPTERLRSLERDYRMALLEADVAEATTIAPNKATRSRQIGELQRSLGESALIEYFVTDGRIGAFIVSGDDVIGREAIASMEEVERLGRRLEYHMGRAELLRTRLDRAVEAAMQQAILPVLRRLYDILIAPLLEFFTARRLIIVPYGPLHGLPFQAMCDGDGYLLDRFVVSYSPSAAVWLETLHRGRTKSGRGGTDGAMLLMGAPADDLPHVEQEIRQLESSLTAPEVFCGAPATIDNFMKSAPRASMIHLAMHAQFRSDNPMFSGMRFADGWLLARDLYGMRLDCDLVTLSACRTGVVKVEQGDEIFGLARGFLAAGARSLLMSLWPADDHATSLMMHSFYEQTLRGESRADALRTAQQCVRQTYPHPYHWAPFVLCGQ